MILLQGVGLARDFAGDVLFENINVQVQERARIALVGRNGVGKSTLLKMIAGVETPSAGEISKVKDLTIGYLAQDTGLTTDRNILDELLSVFSELTVKEKGLRQLEEEMSELAGEDLSALMGRYDALSEEFRRLGGFTFEAEVKSMLNAFHFTEERWKQPVNSLSGGQKTRLALAKMLLEKPQLLILDEPTNHLDIETLAWLENYLKSYKGALLIVSHDRYFLDEVATEVLEMSRGHVRAFTGNYSDYMLQRDVLAASEQKAFDAQQKEIAKLEDYVARNLARASTTKMAQSRRRKLEKMDRLDAPSADGRAATVIFSADKRSGAEVLKVNSAAIGYDDKILSQNISLDVRRGQALAIVGSNGVGKTTLIKSVMGQLPFISGDAKVGANVSVGYYDQEQGRLTVSQTVLDELWNDHKLLPEVEIRNVLGSFLFSGDDVKKTVGMLSGGEKARLLLAKLAMMHDNFLILDEPTNHLDIDSREVLEQALIDFSGTILFVSHDRYFINRVATEVLELTADGSTLFLGDYDYYLEKKAENVEIAADREVSVSVSQDNRAENKAQQREERKLQREAEKLETEIATADADIAQIEAEMLSESSNFEKLGDLQKMLDEKNAAKEGAELQWLQLLEALEEMKE